jgi:hypothetical protein
MVNRVAALSSKISGIDFGEEGYVEYRYKVQNNDDNSGTNILKIYMNGAISLKRVTIRGNGLGPSTRFFLDKEEDVAEWNAATRTFTINITDEIACKITILENGALLEITSGECDWGIEGYYSLDATD